MSACCNQKGLIIPPENIAVMAEDSHAQRAMARAGLGVVALPLWCGDADPVLVRAQPDAPPLVRPSPVWLVAHRDLHTSRRIRLVFDRIAEGLARVPPPANE